MLYMECELMKNLTSQRQSETDKPIYNFNFFSEFQELFERRFMSKKCCPQTSIEGTFMIITQGKLEGEQRIELTDKI